MTVPVLPVILNWVHTLFNEVTLRFSDELETETSK